MPFIGGTSFIGRSVQETLSRRLLRHERFDSEAAEAAEAKRFANWVAAQEPSTCGGVLGKPVIGQSCQLFRPYTRLKKQRADPSVVRPKHILSASLAALLDPDAAPDGGWAATREQLWSIRQDLLVQHLHSSTLAFRVGLEGARLAATAGDVGELHRSLTPLVAKGACSSIAELRPAAESDEIGALRLLYLTHGGLDGKPGRLEFELQGYFKEFRILRSSQSSNSDISPSPELVMGPAVQCARLVHMARVSGNWLLRLRLIANLEVRRSGRFHGEAPPSCKRLARLAMPSVRLVALSSLVKAFPRTLSARSAASLLGFDGGVGSVAPEAELLHWLREEVKYEVNDGRVLYLDCAKISAKLAALQPASDARRPSDAAIRTDLDDKANNRAEAAQYSRLLACGTLDNIVNGAVVKSSLQDKKKSKKERKKEKKRKKAEEKQRKQLHKRTRKEERKQLKRAKKENQRSEPASPSDVECCADVAVQSLSSPSVASTD